MNWKQLSRALIGAAINSGANAIVLIVVDPLKFNLFQGGATELGQAVLVSALVGAALYVKQHPIEWDDVVKRSERR